MVDALWKVIVEKMCWAFDCSVNTLLEHIEGLYGKATIQPEQAEGDRNNPTVYFNSAVLNAFRLTFKSGLIYMWDWYRTGKMEAARRHMSEMKLVKANSVKAWRQGTITPGFGGYVLRLDRELFMARHRGSDNSKGKPKVAHSAYTSGLPVACAGEIAIADGRVLFITTASGHYQPKPDTLLHVLRVFQMNAVDMTNLIVGIELGMTQPFRRYKALDFMRERGNTSRLTPLTGEQLQKVYRCIPGWIKGTQATYPGISEAEIIQNLLIG